MKKEYRMFKLNYQVGRETASGIECIALPGVYRLNTLELCVAQS